MDNPYLERLTGLRARIAEAARRAGRDAAEITLLAASKFQPPPALRLLAAAGQVDFGENYIQEALEKQRLLADLPLRWHMIGHVQKNKAARLGGRFGLIHSLDSMELADLLHKNAEKQGRRQAVLIQVNQAGESSKHGVSPELARALAEKALSLPGLELRGLMTLPPYSGRAEAARPYFAALRELRDRLQLELGRSLPHLSMGMSLDFEQAVAEGATIVRLGTALLGGRRP